MNIDSKILDRLEDKPFKVSLGGVEVELYSPTSAEYRRLGALCADLPLATESEVLTTDHFTNMLSTRTVCKLIASQAVHRPKHRWQMKSTLYLLYSFIRTYFKRNSVFIRAYYRASPIEIRLASSLIIPHLQLFILSRTIFTLNGQRTLKPTKEIETRTPTL